MKPIRLASCVLFFGVAGCLGGGGSSTDQSNSNPVPKDPDAPAIEAPIDPVEMKSQEINAVLESVPEGHLLTSEEIAVLQEELGNEFSDDLKLLTKNEGEGGVQ